jgi:transcriptional regulator with XRE-family HTH domain
MAESAANFFRARREELGLSQSDISFELRKTIGAISGWERGNVPSIDLVDGLARVYRVTPRKILDVMHGVPPVGAAMALGLATLAAGMLPNHPTQQKTASETAAGKFVEGVVADLLKPLRWLAHGQR